MLRRINYFYMGFLDDMNNIGAATSAASGVGSLLFGQRMSRANARYQMKLQKELLATQQGYAVQNAATDYARQRELMQDTSLLTKLGRKMLVFLLLAITIMYLLQLRKLLHPLFRVLPPLLTLIKHCFQVLNKYRTLSLLLPNSVLPLHRLKA